jgi:hypothetical protein
MHLFLQNNIIIYPKNIYIFYLNLINRLPFSKLENKDVSNNTRKRRYPI